MRVFLYAFPVLLAGCAGYAIDYTKPKTSIIGPELTRYGFSAGQSQCVSDRLGATLSVWQLRQLQIRASSITRGYSDPNRLTPSDLLHVSTFVPDRKVSAEVASAARGCGLSEGQIAVAARPTASAAAPQAAPARAAPATPASPTPPPQAVAPSAPPAARAAPVTWINLGAAPTGQMIAVDASTLREEGAYRTGWFRLATPGQPVRSANSYLLRVDCAARTINSMALRKHNATGAVTEERSFGPTGEGAAQVEAGTVMEIAYLSLCS